MVSVLAVYKYKKKPTDSPETGQTPPVSAVRWVSHCYCRGGSRDVRAKNQKTNGNVVFSPRDRTAARGGAAR